MRGAVTKNLLTAVRTPLRFRFTALRSGLLTGVYRNFTRLVKFPNANPALKNFSALIFHGLPKNRGEIFGGIATSVNPICYTQ